MVSIMDTRPGKKTGITTSAPKQVPSIMSTRPTANISTEQRTALRQQYDQNAKIESLNAKLKSGDYNKITEALKKARAEGIIDQKFQVDVLKNMDTTQQAQLKKQAIQEQNSGIYGAIAAPIVNAVNTKGTALANAIWSSTKAGKKEFQDLQDNLVNAEKQQLQARLKFRKDNPNSTQAEEDAFVKPLFDKWKQAKTDLAQYMNKQQEETDPVRQIAADFTLAQLPINIATVGGTALGTQLAKLGTSVAGKTALGVLGSAAGGALEAASTNALNEYLMYGQDTDIRDVNAAAASGAVGGAILSGTLGGLGIGFGALRDARLASAKQAASLGENLMPEISAKQFEDFTPRKITVAGDDVAQGVEIKIVKPLTEAEYVKQVTKLGKAYDADIKAIQGMNPARQQLAQAAIDERYTQALTQLDEMKTTTTVKPKIETPTKVVTTETPATTAKPVVEAPQVTKTGTIAEQLPTTQTKVPTNKVEFNATSYKENKISALDLAKNDKQTAIDMTTGKIEATQAQRQELYKVLSEQAQKENDWATIDQLSNPRADVEASIAGQTLGQRGYDTDPFSATSLAKEAKKGRAQALRQKTGIVLDNAIDNADKAVKKMTKSPTVKDWSDFVESLRCK